MNLYLISRKGAVTYDEYDSMVIRARNEDHARELAAVHDTFDSKIWLAPTRTSVEKLSQHGSPGVVLGSFNAG